jgi:probable F420-dependent oxidoreductase
MGYKCAMAHERRFRFGVDFHQTLEDRSWMETAREVEDLGYGTLFVPDHFDEGFGPIAALAAAAAVTSTLNVGALVFDCDFRHPAVLARELTTIDQVSEGRLEVGLGAGWKRLDYERSGIPMDAPKVRVDRLVEYTTILRRLFAGEAVRFKGEHFQISDLTAHPPAARSGGPPILIGGGGRRVLRFAGANADIVGVNASVHSGEIDADAGQDGLPERIDQKIAWLRDGAGDRFDDLELNAWAFFAEVTDDSAGFAGLVAPMFDVAPDQLLQSPLVLVGSPNEIGERLHERRERWGYSYHVIPGDQARAFAPVVAALSGK